MSGWDVLGYAMWATFFVGAGLVLAGIAKILRHHTKVGVTKVGVMFITAGIATATASVAIYVWLIGFCSYGRC